MTLTDRTILGYIGCCVVLALAVLLSQETMGYGDFGGALLAGIPLASLYGLSQWRGGRFDRVFVPGLVASLAGVWLWQWVSEMIASRGRYQYPLPFILSGVLAVPLGAWLFARRTSARKRMLWPSIVFTLLLTPIPYGPEGALLPLVVTLVFPPLVFLLLFPGWILLSFLLWLGCFTALYRIRHWRLENNLEIQSHSGG